jgi:hypothetical protein
MQTLLWLAALALILFALGHYFRGHLRRTPIRRRLSTSTPSDRGRHHPARCRACRCVGRDSVKVGTVIRHPTQRLHDLAAGAWGGC